MGHLVTFAATAALIVVVAAACFAALTSSARRRTQGFVATVRAVYDSRTGRRVRARLRHSSSR